MNQSYLNPILGYIILTISSLIFVYDNIIQVYVHMYYTVIEQRLAWHVYFCIKRGALMVALI